MSGGIFATLHEQVGIVSAGHHWLVKEGETTQDNWWERGFSFFFLNSDGVDEETALKPVLLANNSYSEPRIECEWSTNDGVSGLWAAAGSKF